MEIYNTCASDLVLTSSTLWRLTVSSSEVPTTNGIRSAGQTCEIEDRPVCDIPGTRNAYCSYASKSGTTYPQYLVLTLVGPTDEL